MPGRHPKPPESAVLHRARLLKGTRPFPRTPGCCRYATWLRPFSCITLIQFKRYVWINQGIFVVLPQLPSDCKTVQAGKHLSWGCATGHALACCRNVCERAFSDAEADHSETRSSRNGQSRSDRMPDIYRRVYAGAGRVLTRHVWRSSARADIEARTPLHRRAIRQPDFTDAVQAAENSPVALAPMWVTLNVTPARPALAASARISICRTTTGPSKATACAASPSLADYAPTNLAGN